jgi:nucleotide-binding universal stress UspA family protein
MLQAQDCYHLTNEAARSALHLYKRILVGYDGSAGSVNALKTGQKLALMSKSDLIVVGVRPLPRSDSDEAFQSAVSGALRLYQESFYRLRVASMNEGLKLDTIIALGEPALYLARKARQLHASLLILAATAFLRDEEGQDEVVCARIIPDVMCPVLITP